MRRWVFLALLLLVTSQAAAQYKSETVFAIRRPNAAAAWTTVSGDSGSVAALYPCDNGALADSAGRRVDLTWSASIGGWVAEVDTTGDYSVFYRTGCCAETLAVALQCRRLWGPILPPNLVNWEALEAGAALRNLVESAADSVAGLRGAVIGGDSLRVDADTLEANVANIKSALYLQAGVPPSPSQAILQADDAAIIIRAVPLIVEENARVEGKIFADSIESIGGYIFGDSLYIVKYLRVDGPAWLRGDNTMGTGLSNTLTVNGTVAASNDVTSTDDMTVGDDLTVTDDATFNDAVTLGNDAADQITVVGDLNVTDVTNLNGAMNLGNATSDALTITAATTAEGDFAVEDSIRFGSDMVAADSLKSCARAVKYYIEMSPEATADVSITNGNTIGLAHFPGLRANDCFWCVVLGTTTSTLASKAYELSVPWNGVLKIERDNSSLQLDLRCFVMKN